MRTKRTILTRLVAIALVLPLSGGAIAAGSDEDRIAELEKAVRELQQQNATLKKEADQVRAELANPATPSTSADGQAGGSDGKIHLSKAVSELDIYGELRLRYFFNEATVANTYDHGERNRVRYRMRLGTNIKLLDNLTIGVLVEANNSAHSANVTLGGAASSLPDAEVFNKGSLSTGTAITG